MSRSSKRTVGKKSAGRHDMAAEAESKESRKGRFSWPVSPSATQVRLEDTRASKWELVAISALLVILVFIDFGQTLRHGFINFDDGEYVYENPIVSKGLSLGGIGWALTHVLSYNWHPLTTMVHMFDCWIWGLWAGGHHLTNVLLHAATAVLLFFMLRAMTGARWRSAFVAAVFAIHPLRVESVAWVSELKDVLSGLFFMLTLWSYAAYARQRQSTCRYAIVAIWLALGLMSKAMLVTVPFLLVVLDYWPLGVLRKTSDLPALLLEKLPLLALSVLTSVATLLAQGKAIQSLEHFSFPVRVGNALVAYVVYLGKWLWPTHLSIFYPLAPGGHPAWEVAVAIVLLLAVSAAAFVLRHTHPYLIAGWLWYVGMLVPVIGILQVGKQSYADRYTYLPQIGLCLAATWAVAEWTARWPYRRFVSVAAGSMILATLSVATWRQTAHWRNSETLWTYVIACSEGNSLAHESLASEWMKQGRIDEAMAEYREALRLNPGSAEAHNNLALALGGLGKTEETLAHFHEALRLDPALVEAHNNLAEALVKQGKIQEALEQFHEAIGVDPTFAQAHANLGFLLFQQGKTTEALAELHAALRIDPESAEALSNLGLIFLQQGRIAEAIAKFREALRSNPVFVGAHSNLGLVLFREGQASEAIEHAARALALQPGDADLQNALAWMLATAPQTALRDGPRALALAQQASRSGATDDPLVLRTLAAAYAEAGDFPRAVQTAKSAMRLSRSPSMSAVAEALRREIQLYETERRFEDIH